MKKSEEQTTWQEELNNKRLVRGSGWYGCIAPDGWKKLITEADEMLAYIDPEYKICQIKEKFGTLRYYFETEKTGIERKIMDAIATEAEYASAGICETCGKYGELRNERYYVQTLCNSCESEVAAEYESRKLS